MIILIRSALMRNEDIVPGFGLLSIQIVGKLMWLHWGAPKMVKAGGVALWGEAEGQDWLADMVLGAWQQPPVPGGDDWEEGARLLSAMSAMKQELWFRVMQPILPFFFFFLISDRTALMIVWLVREFHFDSPKKKKPLYVDGRTGHLISPWREEHCLGRSRRHGF